MLPVIRKHVFHVRLRITRKIVEKCFLCTTCINANLQPHGWWQCIDFMYIYDYVTLMNKIDSVSPTTKGLKVIIKVNYLVI